MKCDVPILHIMTLFNPKQIGLLLKFETQNSRSYFYTQNNLKITIYVLCLTTLNL